MRELLVVQREFQEAVFTLQSHPAVGGASYENARVVRCPAGQPIIEKSVANFGRQMSEPPRYRAPPPRKIKRTKIHADREVLVVQSRSWRHSPVTPTPAYMLVNSVEIQRASTNPDVLQSPPGRVRQLL